MFKYIFLLFVVLPIATIFGISIFRRMWKQLPQGKLHVLKAQKKEERRKQEAEENIKRILNQ